MARWIRVGGWRGRVVVSAAALVLCACSGASTTGFGDADGGAGSSGGGSGSGGSGSGGGVNLGGGVSGSSSGSGSGGTSVEATTIYAHTDTTLYSMDPQTKAVTVIGKFAGLGGKTGDTSVTDLAVNAAGALFVNSETVVYQASLPANGTGNVALTKLATIAAQSGQRFYALAFTPNDALGSGTGEVLIGGDGNGELWSIDQSTGATKDVGNFGQDPNDATSILALSGDIVFYAGSTGAPKGIATIRACTKSSKGTTTCSGATDYLAGIDVAALAAAYAGGTPAASLNAGIYGSPSPDQTGPGIGYKDVFGLGVWGGGVYGFTRETTGTPASLVSIATSSGAGTLIPEQVSVSSGWSGAGVTTKVTVTIPPPPTPPK